MLKVGIAGFGVVGKRRKTCVDKQTGMELIAVCDKNIESEGSNLESHINCYSTYQELLQEDLDILIVCMTNEIAPEVTIAGLNKGMHVFCEKPPGRTVEDIENVIEAETKHSNLKLMYGFNHRYHDAVQDALKLVRSKELGNVINLRGVYGKSQLITFNQPDWRTKREIAGGGVLLDQGIHMVDLMRLFAGEFTEVHSYISNSHWGYDVEDNAYALMKTEDGIVGMLNSSATQWRHKFHLEITLEKGSVILGGILSGSKSYGAETLCVVKADPDNDMGDPIEVVTRYNKDPSWEKEIAYFYDCVHNHRKVETGSSSDALNTMKLVYGIYRADKVWKQKYNL